MTAVRARARGCERASARTARANPSAIVLLTAAVCVLRVTAFPSPWGLRYKLHEKSDIEKRAKKGNSDEAKSTTHYL